MRLVLSVNGWRSCKRGVVLHAITKLAKGSGYQYVSQ